jgi:hypothetical protein
VARRVHQHHRRISVQGPRRDVAAVSVPTGIGRTSRQTLGLGWEFGTWTSWSIIYIYIYIGGGGSEELSGF